MKYLLLLFLILITEITFASVEILCKVQYQYKIFRENPINVGTYKGNVIGSGNVYVPNQGGYYETKVSEIYTMKITFYSGHELNEFYNNKSFNENSIVALVKWSNGGYSFVTINSHATKLEEMTENELKFNQNNEPIKQMTGTDNEGRLWQFNF